MFHGRVVRHRVCQQPGPSPGACGPAETPAACASWSPLYRISTRGCAFVLAELPAWIAEFRD
eukprot:494288-Alexandrium_andersonii.AAC.1